MTSAPKPLHSWREALQAMREPRVLTMLFLGFSAGIPFSLIFSSLSLWLGQAGVERSTLTFFSWAALGYSFKFLWSPLMDRLPLPFLTKGLGKRRGWLLCMQILIATSIVLMGCIDPTNQDNLILMAFAATLLGLSAASQDIVIDAYRIEAASSELQAMMASFYITGYRLGMVISGAGALYLAAWLGSAVGNYAYDAWRITYFVMASTMLVGILTTLFITEPEHKKIHEHTHTSNDYMRIVFVFMLTAVCFITSFIFLNDIFTLKNNHIFLRFIFEILHFFTAITCAVTLGYILIKLGAINRAMAREVWIEPILEFFNRYHAKTALILLLLIGLYRITDIIPGIISNVFYQDLGFTGPEIATAVKTIGVFISIAGGFLGGIFTMHYGVMRSLMLGAALTAITNLVFVWLAMAGHDTVVMYLAVTADNLAAGFASAAFVAFLSSLTSISFTAVQYAIFSSLMTLLPKTIGGYSGTIVDNIGYPGFFLFTTFIGIPVIWLVWLINKRISTS